MTRKLKKKKRVGSGDSGISGEVVLVLSMVRIDLVEKVTCEQRLEGGKGVSQRKGLSKDPKIFSQLVGEKKESQ